MSVPWYDFDYRGNDSSYQSLAVHALFTLGFDGGLRSVAMLPNISPRTLTQPDISGMQNPISQGWQKELS
jgi:hypothetical protein